MQGRSALSSIPISQMRITLWVKTIDFRSKTWIIEIHTCSSFFTGHPHGNAIWPICWPRPNFDPWEGSYWLLHWGSTEWSFCTWLLSHSLWRIGPNICQPGKKNKFAVYSKTESWQVKYFNRSLIQFQSYNHAADLDLYCARFRVTPKFAPG